MKFNIDTLLLDIQFQGAGEIDQSQQIKKIETLLKVFIQNAFIQMPMPELPAWLILLQEKSASNLESQRGKESLTIDNIEVNLPVIDGHRFLQGTQNYFENNILPELKKSLNRALQEAIQKACLLTLKGSAKQDDVLAGEEHDTKNVIHGRLTHKRWNTILDALKTSVVFNANFKKSLLNPAILAKLVSSIFNNIKHSPDLLNAFLSTLYPALNHGPFIPLLDHNELNLTQKKQQLKRYLRLILTAPEPQTERTQAAIKVILSSSIIVNAVIGNIDSTNGLEKTQRQRLTHALTDLHQVLLMPQEHKWLNAIENWLNIVVHQGMRVADLVGLENLLKRAKGSHLQLPSAMKMQIQPCDNHRLEGSHNLKQSITVYQRLLTLLTSLQGSVISLEYRQYQVQEIKRYLAQNHHHIPADVLLLIKQALQTEMNEVGGEEENEYNVINTELKQLTTSIALLEDDLPINRLETLQQRIINALNNMTNISWMPISLNEKIQGINERGINKQELTALLKKITTWSQLVNTVLNTTIALISVEDATGDIEYRESDNRDEIKSVIEIRNSNLQTIKFLITYLKEFIEAESNRNLTAYDSVSYQFAIKIYFIPHASHLPVEAEKALKDFIRITSKLTAVTLKDVLEAWISVESNNLLPLITTAAIHDSSENNRPQQQSYYKENFLIEWQVKQQINQVLKDLTDMIRESPELKLIPHPISNTVIENKQQLYRILIQLITALITWQQQGNTDILDYFINKLQQIKDTLHPQVSGLMLPVNHDSHWWLPIASSPLAKQGVLIKNRPSVQSSIHTRKIHQLMWQSDLNQASHELGKFSQDSLEVKQSQQLLKKYREKISKLSDVKSIKNVSQKFNQNIQNLLKQQTELQQSLACIDAGLVLLWPYLAGFFKKNDLLIPTNNNETDDKSEQKIEMQFKDQAAQLKAHALLVHILDVQQTEQVYTVANLLVGLEPDTYVENAIELSEQEQTNANQLLSAVINNWPALKNMPLNSFRELFLLRNAQYSSSEQGCIVEIDPKTLDILLTKLPWGLGYISLPWLGKNLIQVKWAYGF